VLRGLPPGSLPARSPGGASPEGQRRRRHQLLLRIVTRAIHAAGAPASADVLAPPSAEYGRAHSPAPTAGSIIGGSGDGPGDDAGSGEGGLAALGPVTEHIPALDGRGTKEQLESDVQRDLDALLSWKRANDTTDADEERPTKRRRGALAEAAAEAPQDARYGTLASQTRAHFEGRGDWKAALPMVTERDNMKSGTFDTMRLRELERLMLTIDPSGSSRPAAQDVGLSQRVGRDTL